jgi:hypothetical protein
VIEVIDHIYWSIDYRYDRHSKIEIQFYNAVLR